MSITPDVIVRLVLGLIWPVVVLVLALVFRHEVGAFLEGIIGFARGGLSKVSLPGGFAFELVKTTEYKVDWTGPGGQDLRNMVAMGQPASGVPDILGLLKPQQPSQSADYVVFDLGSGKKWLSSRLYLFSTLLRRTHGLRYCVFVYDTPDVNGRSLGFATTEAVRWSLARKYPHLEHAAHTALLQNEIIVSRTGALDPQSATSFIQTYLKNIQINPLLSTEDLKKDPKGFARSVLEGPGLSSFLRSQLPADALNVLRAAPAEYWGLYPVVNALNALIQKQSLYEESRFTGISLSDATKKLVAQNPEGDDRTLMNRFLLEEAYPQFIAPAVSFGGTSAFKDEDWVKLKTGEAGGTAPTTLERARWLDWNAVEKLLGMELGRAQVQMSSLQAVSRKDQVSMLLRVEGAMVAVVSDGAHFERLVDRQALAARAIEFTL